MARGTRRSDIKGRLTPRRLSWVSWFMARLWVVAKILGVAAAVIGLVLWVWAQGYLVKTGDWAQGKMANMAASAGMKVADVIVEGRNHIDTETLKTAIAVTPDMPIFAVDIDAIHARITAIPWVREVQVRRALPDRVLINITERLPIALWVDAPNSPAVIDDTGVMLTHDGIASYGTLLAVEGKGAEHEAGNIIALLKGQPDIAVRVKKAVYVSGRRWDIVLDGGLILRLPEDDPGFALARASKAQLEQKVFEMELKAVDMRQPGRIILESRGEKRDLLLKQNNPV